MLLLFLSMLEHVTLFISAEKNFSGYSLLKNHDFILVLPLYFIKLSSLEHNLLMHRVCLKTRLFGVVLDEQRSNGDIDGNQ